MVRRRSLVFTGAKLPGSGTGGYPTGSLFIKGGSFGAGTYINIGTKSACCFVQQTTRGDQYACVTAGQTTTTGGDTTETVTTVGHLPVGANVHPMVSYNVSDDSDSIDKVNFATNTLTYIASANPVAAHQASWAIFDQGGIADHYVVAAGIHTTTGGAAADTKTVTGVVATDLLISRLHTPGSTARTLDKSEVTANTLTFTFNDDPSSDHLVNYVVLRPKNSGVITMNESHQVFTSGNFTSTSGSATQTTSVTGLKTTDVIFADHSTVPDANDTLLNAYCTTAGTLGVLNDADPGGTGYVYSYIVFRAI